MTFEGEYWIILRKTRCTGALSNIGITLTALEVNPFFVRAEDRAIKLARYDSAE